MRLNCLRRRHQDRTGATMVEAAFVMPVIIILTFGLIEFARAFMAMQMVNAAARHGAYMSILDGVTNSEAETAMRDMLATANIEDNVTIQILDGQPIDDTPTGGDLPDPDDLNDLNLPDALPRQLLIVRISVPFEDIAFITPWWLNDVTIVGQMAMRHE